VRGIDLECPHRDGERDADVLAIGENHVDARQPPERRGHVQHRPPAAPLAPRTEPAPIQELNAMPLLQQRELGTWSHALGDLPPESGVDTR